MSERTFVQLDDIAKECFKHTVSLFWGEPEGALKLRSGTGFLVELDRPFLFTARHVIQAFLEAQRENKSLELKIGKGSIDQVNNRMMVSNDSHDLAAIDLSGININEFQLNHIQFFKPKRWPPKCISPGAQVFFIGFVVNGYREILNEQRAILFNSFTVGTQVDSISDTDFSCAISMENVNRNATPDVRWPTDYGGLSGSPIFVIWEDIGLEFIGIVYEANNAFHIIRAHHAHLFNSFLYEQNIF